MNGAMISVGGAPIAPMNSESIPYQNLSKKIKKSYEKIKQKKRIKKLNKE